MSRTKKTIKLGKIKQLIDLNGDSTNFDISFNVSCRDDTPFHLLVVDQTTLDNSPELQYKEVSGSINGNIVADKNLYQNHFLILKSENPCEVDVEFTKKILPKTPESALQMQPLELNGQEPMEPTRREYKVNVPPEQSIPWMKICLIALVVIVGGVVLWWLYKRKSNPKESSDTGADISFDKPEEYSYSLNKTQMGKIYNHSATPVSSRHGTPSPHHGSSGADCTSHDSRGFRPVAQKLTVSPNLISRQSSPGGGDGGNSLLYRLRKFAK
jgi:hypothetical protein